MAERLLWEELRELKQNYRRQAPIGRYVVDFVHHARRLIVEIDGPSHDGEEAQARDAERTAALEALGYKVVRFGEKQVRDGLSDVIDRIVAEPPPPPSPTLPPSRGKGAPRYLVR